MYGATKYVNVSVEAPVGRCSPVGRVWGSLFCAQVGQAAT